MKVIVQVQSKSEWQLKLFLVNSTDPIRKWQPEEDAELRTTGNFGGGAGWFSGQVKNLPPVTPVNSFESDVMGVTPIDNSQIDNP